MHSLNTRRNWLGENVPRCPECGERHQIQLTAYIAVYPARWKCRICKHKFSHEPKETHHEAS